MTKQTTILVIGSLRVKEKSEYRISERNTKLFFIELCFSLKYKITSENKKIISETLTQALVSHSWQEEEWILFQGI